MFYVYILRSRKDKKFYTGFTEDLQLRFEAHAKGTVPSTRDRLPLDLVYYEACVDKLDACHREVYLKTAHGKHFIKQRLKSYLTG